MSIVRLKPGHVQPIWLGHPWVYAQAIDRVDGGATAGDEVSVVDPRGNLLGRGFYSPQSAIPVRLLVRDATTALDAAFFRDRVRRAVEARARLDLPNEQVSGFRLVHAEGDGLPGLVVDRYGEDLVLQIGTVGMKRREMELRAALAEVTGARAILDRTTAQAAKAEGFEAAPSLTYGLVYGPPIEALEFVERAFTFRIPVELGQKTGFYFDQRALRARVEQLARGAERVLDAYAFVGSFALAAARAGVREVVAVDDSAPAVAVGSECAALNGVGDRVRFIKGDARRVLADANGTFDLVIADPPRLAPTRSAREPALVAYARLAENMCRAVRPGGLLVLCCCSAAVDLASLTRALATGATRARADAVVLERWFQGPDHPVPAAFGEGLYLKALVARVEPR